MSPLDKIKDIFGNGYKPDIEQMRREQEEHIQTQKMEYDRQRQMMNSAQNSAMQNVYGTNPYQQQEKYRQGWNDPRAARLTGATPITSEEALVDSIAQTNQALKRMAERLEKQERRVEMLTGFYTWVTEVHPEITAQHKAMRDLYEAANAPQQEKEA